jgi:hypothetical protein
MSKVYLIYHLIILVIFKVMDSFAASNFLTPTIAILSSEGAEAVALRNNLSFTDLLSPFCTAHQTIVNVRFY